MRFILKKLFKALAILTSFSVLTRALGFLFRIFLSRLIGAEGLGVYQISFSVYMVLETFIASGLPLTVSKMTSSIDTQNNKQKEFSLVTTAVIIGVITSLILCLIVLMFKNLFSLLFTDKRCLNILITLLPALVFSSVYSILRGNLWGHRKYFLVSLTEFLEQLIRIIICVVIVAFFYSTFDGALAASISFIISCIISSLLVLFFYLKCGGKFKKPKNYFKPLIKASLPISLVKVISSLLMPIISIIIPIQLVAAGYSNEQALGIFGVAMGMTFPLLYIPSTIVGSLSMTLIPDLSSAASTNNQTEIHSKISFSIKFAYFVSFLFVPLFFALGEPIGVFLYNNIQSGQFLSYASWLVIPICLSGITVSSLNALNLEIKGFINYGIGALFLILSILFLTKHIGVLSLVWGMGLCLSIATILNLKMLNKKLNGKFFNFKYLSKLIIASIPCCLMAKWTYDIFKIFLPIFFSLGFSAIIGELFFLVFAYILKLFNFSFVDFKIKIFKKNNKKLKTNLKNE